MARLKVGPLGAGEAANVIEIVPCLGYRLDFVTVPTLLGPGRALPVSRFPQENVVMGEEIGALLKNGAIEQVHEDSPGFFSFLFLVPKKGGGETSQLITYVKKETISHDHAQGGGPVHSPWRLVHFYRPAGRIPPCPGTQRVTQVPQIFMDGENILVQKTTLRTDVISTSIYRHHLTPGGTLQNQRHQSDFT